MSKIEVNTITQQCGPSLTVGGGACKSVTLDATTVTLGRCGATVSLAAGATQSGFGRTGTVDWCTTAKTAPFTGVSGKGYFVNTTCGAVTVTLPATPSAGDIVSLKDYAGTWNSNNLTVCNNSSKINGFAGSTTLSAANQSVTLIYVDGTQGWTQIQDSTINIQSGTYITATGGTIITCGDYKTHVFTSNGTFCVSAGSGPLATVSYIVVAGGGGSGGDGTGGGGAGGFREGKCSSDPYPASPLAASGLPVSVQAYPITIGAGGAAVGQPIACGNSGSNSVFSTITSAGGGAGNGNNGSNGGSGGGGGRYSGGPNCGSNVGGLGNTPPVSPPQGNDGGDSPSPLQSGGGGGGATTAGTDVTSPGVGGAGGTGAATGIAPASYGESSCGSYYFSGGGGGSSSTAPWSPGAGGLGGGGCGANGPSPSPNPGSDGTANTGGGGGGSSGSTPGTVGRNGGSGIVVIRYKFQ